MGPGGPKNKIVKFKAKADPWNEQKITTHRLGIVSGPVPKSHKVTSQASTRHISLVIHRLTPKFGNLKGLGPPGN